jgi:HAD superfamily hydrolase (TIGR01549 family)
VSEELQVDSIEAVLFDLEDTLIRTPWSDPRHVAEFRRETKQKLRDLGIPSSVLKGVERATIMRNKASEYVEQKLSEEETERFRLEMDSFLGRYERDSAGKSVLFPDTIPALERLRELGAKMGLVTNTSAEAANAVFEVHNLTHFFGVVITRENVRRLKPDPEGVLLALEQLGASCFFMVGDLVLDVLAAKGANGVAILVIRPGESNAQDLFKSLPTEALERTKGTYDKDDLQADYIIESLAEVPRIVQREREKRAL